MVDLRIVLVRQPIVTRNFNGTGSMTSEVDYVIVSSANVGQQVAYVSAVIDNDTNELLEILRRFVVVESNAQFSSRSMNVIYPNFDLHPNLRIEYNIENAAGTVNLSNIIRINISGSTPTVTVPDAPIMNNPALITETTAGISWRVPSNDGGSPITNYRLKVTNLNFGGSIITQSLGNVVSHNLTGLDPDTSYRVEVQAENSVGNGSFSNSKIFTTLIVTEPPPTNTVPDAPILNSLALITATTAGVSWRVPSSDGGSPIIRYELLVGNVSTGNINTINVGNVVSHNLTGLDPDTSYSLQIVAINSIGVSPLSNTKTFITLIVPEPDPTLPNTNFEVTFTNPSISSFTDRVSNPSFDILVNAASLDDRWNITFLSNTNEPPLSTGNQILGFIESLLEAPPPADTVPTAPTMNNVALITETTAGISWRVPSSDGGAPVLNYTLKVNNLDNGTSASQSVGNVVSFNLDTLTSGTNYSVEVSAQNSVGNSLFSNSKTFTTLSPQIINSIFRVLIDEGIFDKTFIISQSELPVIDSHTFDPRVVLQNVGDGTTINPVTHTALAVIAEIDTFIANNPDPNLPNENSYTMELTSSEYKGTPEGKTVFLQIEITRIGVGVTNAEAILVIKQSNTGLAFFNQILPLTIGGANVFSIVFDIADIGASGEATAKIDIIVQLKTSLDGIALTQFPVTDTLVFDAGGNGNGNGDRIKGSILSKALGFTALLGTASLLATRRR